MATLDAKCSGYYSFKATGTVGEMPTSQLQYALKKTVLGDW